MRIQPNANRDLAADDPQWNSRVLEWFSRGNQLDIDGHAIDGEDMQAILRAPPAERATRLSQIVGRQVDLRDFELWVDDVVVASPTASQQRFSLSQSAATVHGILDPPGQNRQYGHIAGDLDVAASASRVTPDLINRHRMTTLASVVWDGIRTRDPYVDDIVPQASVFHTNYDWHSSVHAHWAALSMARLSGDTTRQQEVLALLTPAAIQAERDLLNANPNFELPYGQAWLLVLINEMQRTPGGDSPALRGLRAETEARLIGWLENPTGGEGAGNVTSAQHDAWLMNYALLTMSRPSDPDIIRRMAALTPRIDAARAAIQNHQPGESDFLYLPAVLAVIDRSPLPGVGARAGVLPTREALLSAAQRGDWSTVNRNLVRIRAELEAPGRVSPQAAAEWLATLREVETLANTADTMSTGEKVLFALSWLTILIGLIVLIADELDANSTARRGAGNLHQDMDARTRDARSYPLSAGEEPLPTHIVDSNSHSAGRLAVRLWPLAMAANEGDTEAAQVVDRRLTAMFARPELYRSSFEDVSHWVPQFMWMTMYLQRGAP